MDNQSKKGIVYVLSNVSMPGYIKIGKTTTSITQRILELSSSTSIPLPFECNYATEVDSMNEVEHALHDAFGDHRVNPRREFFKIAPERVIAVLRLLSTKDITPSIDAGIENKDDAEAIAIARKKRSAFNFKMVDIPPGAELMFIRDESIICTVSQDQKHVDFRGQTISVSKAASQALGHDYQVQGPAYWTYEGEILDEIRTRMEEEIPTEEEIDAAGDEYIQNQIDISLGK